jgi:hypothetical protein
MRSVFAGLLALALALGAASRARADSLREGPRTAGDELTISLLTFGPGDHPFSKFGHNGLLIENAELGTRVVYNYGTFSFDSIGLIPKFLLGKYRYWLSVQGLATTLAAYASENRSVVAQELRLTAEQKRTMAEFLAWNARDENKYYVFDYYRDNCATRIRDLIDRADHGSLARASALPAQMTWRQHTERLTADNLPVYAGLYVAMGNVIDRPITQWEEMFLPAKLADGVARAGLVEKETTLFGARRSPPRATRPAWTLPALLAGAIGAAIFYALGRGAATGLRAARVALGVLLGGFGLVTGLLGSLFAFLWIFTNHEVAFHNENLMPCAPFGLVLVVLGFDIARGRTAAARAARVSALGLACSVIGLVLKALPWFNQDNGQVLALALPLWAGAAASTYLIAGRRASLRPTSRDGSNERKSSPGVAGGDEPGSTSPSAAASAPTTSAGRAPASR